ncbi:MAG: phosphomannomutase [Myxococcota bacterium]
MTTTPSFLERSPVELKFGTSGLRGLVGDMTDLEVFINTQGFLRYLKRTGQIDETATVAVGRDLRDKDPKTGMSSSPRIAGTVIAAIRDAGYSAVDCGQLPTPALAAFAMAKGRPAIMVTGSHIPADRNGMKFYRTSGEILKSDEAPIFESVAEVRAELYAQDEQTTRFNKKGMLKVPATLSTPDPEATELYINRYRAPFADRRPLAGQRIVVYEHSAAARDLLINILKSLGAEVISVGRSDTFISVDTEDVSTDDETLYRNYVQAHEASALVSTDGDGDRPLIVDERGRFHRGDAVGLLCALRLNARFAAVPVSATDAIERHNAPELTIVRTRIGSPYVIDAMNEAVRQKIDTVVGWEANGGFLTGTRFELNGHTLAALPTRDAMLPILTVLIAAAEQNIPVSSLFAQLPQRATRAGLIDDFCTDRGRALLAHLSIESATHTISFSPVQIGDNPALDLEPLRQRIQRWIGDPLGLGPIVSMNVVDGLRMTFATGEIVHLRPSGNAPQFRIYAVADTPSRADALIEQAISEPDGIVRKMETELQNSGHLA